MTDGGIVVIDVGGNLINFYTTISKYMYLFVYFNVNQQQPFLLISIFKKCIYLILLWVGLIEVCIIQL